MNTEVYASVMDGDVERALQQTCQCLLRDQWKPLQETWVRLLSLCGERLYHSQQTPLFYRLVVELDTLLRQDDLPVKQALTMTTQLVVLFKRPFMKPRAANKATLQRLRSKVITYFPVDAQLTRSGKQKFQRFLPSDPEESAFAERIIAGLLQLCESQSPPEDLKDALEYLARKKLVLYTAPVLTLVAGAGTDADPPPPIPPPEDLVGYLWMVLKLIKPLSFDEVLERMYHYEYRSTYKNARLGYLYAMAFVSENSATSCAPVWSQTEQVLIQKVQENFLELWKEAKQAEREDDDGDAGAEAYDDRLDVLSFVPTAPIRAAPMPEAEPKAALKKVAKVIHINKGKGRNRLIQRQENFKLNTDVDADTDADADADADDRRPVQPSRTNGERDNRKRIQAMALNYIPMRNALKEIPPMSMKPNASHRDSSGHRRIHFGEARSRVQNGDESEGSL